MSEGNTIFHKIINREIPTTIVAEDDRAIAFEDINPVSPTHILVVPKKTMPALRDAQPEDEALLGHMLLMCAQIARDKGIAADGYRVVINVGPNGGQEVHQLHMHVLGGRKHTWPPG